MSLAGRTLGRLVRLDTRLLPRGGAAHPGWYEPRWRRLAATLLVAELGLALGLLGWGLLRRDLTSVLLAVLVSLPAAVLALQLWTTRLGS